MVLLASPAQIALSTVAVGWPVAAALGFVVWSDLRRRRQPEERAATRRLASVIEALDATDDLGERITARRRRAAAPTALH